MEKGTGMLLIAGACMLVLLIGSIKNRMEWILNFGIRTDMGGIVICLINSMLKRWGIDCQVGLGPVSLLTSGTLGFSGVSLLYAVSAFHLL